MRLTGSRRANVDPAAPSPPSDGDTLLPGHDLVEELRREVEVLDTAWIGSAAVPRDPDHPRGLVPAALPAAVALSPPTPAATIRLDTGFGRFDTPNPLAVAGDSSGESSPTPTDRPALAVAPPIDELLDSVDVQQVKPEDRGVMLPGEPKPAAAGKVTVRKSTTKDRRGKRFARRKQNPGTAADSPVAPAS